MPRGPNGQKRPADAIGAAVMVGRIATGEISEDIKSSSGRVKSGKAGGRARSESMSSEARVAVAKKAAAKRWKLESAMDNLSGTAKLNALLFDEGRELLDLKFFPGEDPSSADAMLCAGERFLRRSHSMEGENVVPQNAKESRHFSVVDLALVKVG